MGAGGRQADLQRPGQASARAKARTHARADRGARKVGTLSFKQKQLMLARVINNHGRSGRPGDCSTMASPFSFFFLEKRLQPFRSWWVAGTHDRVCHCQQPYPHGCSGTGRSGFRCTLALMMFRFTPNKLLAWTGFCRDPRNFRYHVLTTYKCVALLRTASA